MIERARLRVVGTLSVALVLAGSMVLAEAAIAPKEAFADLTDPPASGDRPDIIAPQAVHEAVVSDLPVSWTPQVLDGKISDIVQVGDTIVAGGNFSDVAPSSGTPVLHRSNVFAFSALNGAIKTSFAPAISGGVVNAVEKGPLPGTVFLGGNFQGVNGVTGKLVLVDIESGDLVPGFTPPSMNGAVNDLQLVGDRLYVGGIFKRVASHDHGGLVALNAMTGAHDDFLQVDLTENHNYTGRPGQARAGVGAKSIAVTPQGDMMAVVGNFRKANGAERRQIAMVDLSGPTAQLRADWRTDRLAPSCFSHAFDTYVRDIDVAPDGSYFVLATTGGPNSGTLCDTISRWEVEAEGQQVQPTWVDETGGDTLLSAASSGTAVYTGGHQRWMNNLNGRDYANPGAVPRAGIGAVEVGSGVPIAWNPGRHPRGVGAEALYVSDSGLWVGSDTEWIGNRTHRRPRLAYFPLAGGTPVAEGTTGELPANVYMAREEPESDDLIRLWFEGADVQGPLSSVSSGDIDWSDVRGAVVIDNVLHYATGDGEFIRRSFDGDEFGDAEVIDPYNDPYWSDVYTSSGGHYYRGVQPSFYNQLSALNGMSYLDGKLFYTVAGSNRLFSRAFSPNSGVITQRSDQVPAFTQQEIGEIFFDESNKKLYFVDASTGDLSRVDWEGSQTDGDPERVSGPSVDGVDWRSTAVFIGDGPEPETNEPPIAEITASCERLECEFSGANSSDPDGEIVAFTWDFGDGSDSAAGETVTHAFAEAGTYTVTLTVTDNDEAVGSAVIEHEVHEVPAPVALIENPTCEGLDCAFDGTGSSVADEGNSIVSFEWDFGDGSDSATGGMVTHQYDDAGSYIVTLTVTDENGTTGSTTYELELSQDPDPGGLVGPELVGMAASSSDRGVNPSVSVPQEVQAGDLLVFFVSTNQTDEYAAPEGWVEERRVVSGGLVVSVFTRVATAADSGSLVGLELPHASIRADLTMAAYRGVHDDGVEALESVISSRTEVHDSPQVMVGGDERVVLTFFADRSSSTTQWTAPSDVEVLSTQVGTGGGRLGTLLTAASPGSGSFGPLTAQTDAPSGRGVAVMLVLAPHEQSEAQTPRGPLETGRADTPEGRLNSQTAQELANEEDTYHLENADEQEEPADTDGLAVLIGTNNVSILTSAPVVDVPNEVEPGDLMVLLAAAEGRTTYEAPEHWRIEAEETSDELSVAMFTKRATDDDRDSQIEIAPDSSATTDLTLALFRTPGERGITGVEFAEYSDTASYPAPMPQTDEEGLELSYWATISAADSEWEAPEEVDVLSEPMESRDTGLNTLLVSRNVPGTASPELVAQTAANSERAFSFAFLLPSEATL